VSHAQKPVDAGRSEYLACYHAAVTNGLTREALWAAAAISATYLSESQPAEAIVFLEPLLETAKSLVPSVASWVVLGNAVDAYTQVGNVAAAASHLRYMEHSTITDLDFFGLSRWLAALVYLKMGDYAAALSASEAAEAIFARIGSKRPLQRSLLAQGEALVALGRFAQARRLLRAVIAAEDPRLLARAYDLMAVVSDDKKYLTLAQELRS
jgi:tetratricopeptide (TPR) repeat protein